MQAQATLPQEYIKQHSGRHMLKFARNAAANVKNRLRPVRYVYKGFNLLTTAWQQSPALPVPPENELYSSLERLGSFQAKSQLSVEKLNWISNIASQRAAKHSYMRSNDYPFVDLLQDEDFANPDNPIIDQIFDEQLLNAAAWYFNGRPLLTRCFLAYSKPQESNNWSQTQLWHLDSDDFRMLRVVLYLTKVDDGAGPFVFVNKVDSPSLGQLWSPRMSDDEFTRLCGGPPKIHRFLGSPGDMLFIDSAQCFHCGARTLDSERISLVMTFTTRAPCNQRHPLIRRHKQTLYRHLVDNKPEISTTLLKSLLF